MDLSDAQLRQLLENVRTIAVVGIKSGEGDDAYQVPRYLQQHGYRILPVSPKLTRVLDEPATATLADVGEHVDLVNVFRAPRHVPGHVDEVLGLSPLPRAVWLQLGIRHDDAAARLAQAGVEVVQDRCLRVEHRRLLGGV
jgi:predicted CoA-binding protein